MISAQGVATDEGKIEAIKKWQFQKCYRGWKFPGICGYYHQFIPKFTQVAWPLHELTSGENIGKKKAAIQWDNRCLCWFHPAFQAPHWCLWVWFGSCSLPDHEDGTDTVIVYASRSSTKAESHFPTHKLEFLALKWAVVKNFHKYLYGSTFNVYSDNNPWLTSLQQPSWMLPVTTGSLLGPT